MQLEKYSIGVGDRFGHQGAAQLRALISAQEQHIEIVPIWNKSNREHSLIGTKPENARGNADEAVKKTGWKKSYYVDADHIGLKTVDKFLAYSNFYTIDVADFIGTAASENDLSAFAHSLFKFKGSYTIPGIASSFVVTDELLHTIGRKYLVAVQEASKIYQYIKKNKEGNEFIVEVSMDETDKPQTPIELFFILAAITQEKIPIQTIAPKFSGEFLKGIDYVGNVQHFAVEFENDLLVIAHAIKIFGLPANLKLSVHSGSDKFSLYPVMHNAIQKHNAGLHLKTAGTTWLEELIGLAEAGSDGLVLAKDIYAQAFARIDELSQPYATVVMIDRSKLPLPAAVASWTSEQFTSALRHDQSSKSYNLHMRQLLHIAFKIAAEMGNRYLSALEKNEKIIGSNVTANILKRHIEPLFIGKK
ncbi:MAG: tagaturonate epimerase family protein [Bacteroidota bacterium]|nr:tagaturonate epimerase family protein [Bacteroidota bacterium]